MNHDLLYAARILAAKELREMGNKGTTVVMLGAIVLIGMFNFAFVARSLVSLPGVPTLLANMVLTHYAFSMSLFVSAMLMNTVFIKEAQTGTMEALLTTPLSPLGIWLGKTMFVYAAGLITAAVAAATGLVVLNVALGSGIGPVWPTPPAIGYVFGVLPVLSLGVTGLFGIVNLLYRNGVIGNALLLLLGMLYLGGASSRLRSMQLSWTTDLALFATGCATLVLMWGLSRLLTNERIVARLG